MDTRSTLSRSATLCTLVLSAALVACGGSGGMSDGGASAIAPPEAVNIAYDVKTYRFSWAPVPGAVTYKLLEDADGPGPGGFAQVGGDLASAEATHAIPVLLQERLHARYAVQACDASQCSEPSAQVQPDLLRAIGYFKASNSATGDAFGAAMALSQDGSTLAVGAPGEDGDNDAVHEGGAVYVFVKSEGTWKQQAILRASNPGSGDQFGERTLALSANGDVLAVGAPGEDGKGTNPSDDSVPNAGTVYVFSRSAGVWTEKAYLKPTYVSPDDQFGYSVSLSADGTRLAVGAPFEDNGNLSEADDDSLPDSGAVYLFTQDGPDWTHWTQSAYLKASDRSSEDHFGASVALSADGATLVVGATDEDSGSATTPENTGVASAGAAYVFSGDKGVWTEVKYLKADAPAEGALFGTSVAVSSDGGTIVVGANSEDSGRGATYVFERNGTGWAFQVRLVPAALQPDGSSFGSAVSLSSDGNVLLVGTPGDASAAVGIDGDGTDLGAPHSGAAYVFKRQEGAWAQAAYLKAPNTAKDSTFGAAVALSGDGTLAAVGAPDESSSATGINGNQADLGAASAGAVYLY